MIPILLVHAWTLRSWVQSQGRLLHLTPLEKVTLEGTHCGFVKGLIVLNAEDPHNSYAYCQHLETLGGLRAPQFKLPSTENA